MRNATRILIFALLLALLAGAAAEPAEEGITVPALDNIRRQEIPDNEAMDFLKRMGVGWNLGNTFDAWRNGGGNEMDIEKYWCGVMTTEEMIEAVHAAGFSTLRMPVSWHNHVDAEFQISQPWLDRVQQVVDWAIDRGMTVILNTHHDVFPEFYYPSEACMEQSERYIGRVWEQLAERFIDYDDHLIFESMNEPRLADTDWEWWFDERQAECLESADCINRLNQKFVDVVRASGGNNASRYLMVPAYCAAPGNAVGKYFTLPQDSADNRIIVSVHAYTPYSFALQEGGESTFSLNPGAQTAEIGRFLKSLYEHYISQGIPVVIGEFGARAKGGNDQDRVNFASFYVAQASARNIPCCWWDNNAFSGNGELFGLFRRADCSWPCPELLEAIISHGGYERIAE